MFIFLSLLFIANCAMYSIVGMAISAVPLLIYLFKVEYNRKDTVVLLIFVVVAVVFTGYVAISLMVN